MKKGREARTHRLTLRLPAQLHEAIVPVATEDSRYVADWIVVTLQHAVATYNPEQPFPRALVRVDEYHRLAVRVPPSLHKALVEIAGTDSRSISRWISTVLERAIAERAALRQT